MIKKAFILCYKQTLKSTFFPGTIFTFGLALFEKKKGDLKALSAFAI
jgi:hypothetical protein